MRHRLGVRLPGGIFIPIIPVLAYFKTTTCCGAVAGRMVYVLYDMSVCQAQGRGGAVFGFSLAHRLMFKTHAHNLFQTSIGTDTHTCTDIDIDTQLYEYTRTQYNKYTV